MNLYDYVSMTVWFVVIGFMINKNNNSISTLRSELTKTDSLQNVILEYRIKELTNSYPIDSILPYIEIED